MSWPRPQTWVALGLCLVFAWVGAAQVNLDLSMGWDEAMHAGWPAARMTLALGAGDPGAFFDAVLDCEQYPFIGPLWTALVWLVTGIDEGSARAAARVLWALGLFGVYLLAAEAARDRRGAGLAPWIALGFAAASPLALAFSGTLFLEVPTTVVLVYTLRAWLRRRRGGYSAELVAGAWITLLFFAKFNYALVIGLALVLDLLCEGAQALRRGEGGAFLRRSALLALLPLASWAWWFGLPLPEGFARGAAHRHAFLEWIRGNTEFAPTPWALRALHWGVFLVWAPRVLALLAIGSIASLLSGPRRSAWSLFTVAVLSIGLVSKHPFHLDRFLLPLAPALWVSAGLGWAAILPSPPRAAALGAGALALAAFAFPSIDAWWLVERVGLRNPDAVEYQTEVMHNWRNLHPARPLFTNGLRRAEFEALVDTVDGAWDGQSKLGWVGISPSLSPGAILLELQRRGGGAFAGRGLRAALASDQLDRSFVDLGSSDPGWDDGKIRSWARGYDLLLTTRPFDISGSPARAWVERYLVSLATSGDWTYASLGVVQVTRPTGQAQEVELFALRRAGD